MEPSRLVGLCTVGVVDPPGDGRVGYRLLISVPAHIVYFVVLILD